MSFRTSVRVEDVLAGGFSIAVAIIGGVGSALAGFKLDEEKYWQMSFLVAPVAFLVFLAAVRYAIGPSTSAVLSTIRQIGSIVRDWLPFFLFILMYEAFQAELWTAVNRSDRDGLLLAWDRALFDETPAVWLQALVDPTLTDILTWCYFLHLVLPPIVALSWYRKAGLPHGQ